MSVRCPRSPHFVSGTVRRGRSSVAPRGSRLLRWRPVSGLAVRRASLWSCSRRRARCRLGSSGTGARGGGGSRVWPRAGTTLLRVTFLRVPSDCPFGCTHIASGCSAWSLCPYVVDLPAVPPSVRGPGRFVPGCSPPLAEPVDSRCLGVSWSAARCWSVWLEGLDLEL